MRMLLRTGAESSGVGVLGLCGKRMKRRRAAGRVMGTAQPDRTTPLPAVAPHPETAQSSGGVQGMWEQPINNTGNERTQGALEKHCIRGSWVRLPAGRAERARKQW